VPDRERRRRRLRRCWTAEHQAAVLSCRLAVLALGPLRRRSTQSLVPALLSDPWGRTVSSDVGRAEIDEW
jgi:hypothetical protein